MSIKEEGRERKKSLAERLQEHPELWERIERRLDVVENPGGDVVKAAEAERRVGEPLQQLGQEVLQAWAARQNQRQLSYWEGRGGVNRKETKDSPGRPATDQEKERNRFFGWDAREERFDPLRAQQKSSVGALPNRCSGCWSISGRKSRVGRRSSECVSMRRSRRQPVPSGDRARRTGRGCLS